MSYEPNAGGYDDAAIAANRLADENAELRAQIASLQSSIEEKDRQLAELSGEHYDDCDLYTISFNSFMRGIEYREKQGARPTDDEAIDAAEKYIDGWMPGHDCGEDKPHTKSILAERDQLRAQLDDYQRNEEYVRGQLARKEKP